MGPPVGVEVHAEMPDAEAMVGDNASTSKHGARRTRTPRRPYGRVGLTSGSVLVKAVRNATILAISWSESPVGVSRRSLLGSGLPPPAMYFTASSSVFTLPSWK